MLCASSKKQWLLRSANFRLLAMEQLGSSARCTESWQSLQPIFLHDSTTANMSNGKQLKTSESLPTETPGVQNKQILRHCGPTSVILDWKIVNCQQLGRNWISHKNNRGKLTQFRRKLPLSSTFQITYHAPHAHRTCNWCLAKCLGSTNNDFGEALTCFDMGFTW